MRRSTVLRIEVRAYHAHSHLDRALKTVFTIDNEVGSVLPCGHEMLATTHNALVAIAARRYQCGVLREGNGLAV